MRFRKYYHKVWHLGALNTEGIETKKQKVTNLWPHSYLSSLKAGAKFPI